MAENVIATATTINGQPAVQVQPTTVPEGNLGGAGKVETVQTPEEAKKLAEAINKGDVDPNQLQTGTATQEQGKKLDIAA